MSETKTPFTEAKNDLILDIIRETGENADWLNRYCQDANTHVNLKPCSNIYKIGDALLLRNNFRLEAQYSP